MQVTEIERFSLALDVLYSRVRTSARTLVQPRLNSVCARPHLTRFLRIRVVPGFSQPTSVCGLKVGRNWVSPSTATWTSVSDALERCTVEE